MTNKKRNEPAETTPADEAIPEPAIVDVRTPGELIGDIQRRLLDTFGPHVGEAPVVRSVTMAVQAVRFFGDDPAQRGSLIERIARNELELLQEGRNERAWT
ncbi:MAG: hypothetical protein QOF57_2312 [Frankiaceae bacterium]|jgi:hypothetical protein|nr:hypothetical protein [Frankiaceae bacterium]